MTQNRVYLRRGALVLLAIAVGGFFADYLFNLGLSRLLSAHDYGDFKVTLAFATLSSTLVLLGGDRAAPRVLSDPFERGDNSAAWEYFRFYFWLMLVLSIVLIVGTLVVSGLHFGPIDPQHHHPLAWIVFAVPLIAVGALFGRILQSAKKLGKATLPWRIAFPLLQLILVLIVSHVVAGFNVVWVIMLAFLSSGLIVVWQGWMILRLKLVQFQRAPDLLMPKYWLSMSIPLMSGFVLALILTQSELYMLEILGEERHVGYFAAAVTTAHFLMLIQVTVIGLMMPLIGVVARLLKRPFGRGRD